MDVLVPAHEKDRGILPRCIESLRANVIGLRDIFVLSRFKPKDADVWIDQDQFGLFPFDMADVGAALPNHDGTARWYWQQLAKLSASAFMPGRRWLQWDADCVLQQPTRFIDDGQILLAPYCDPHWHEPYFAHMKRLIPGIVPTGSQSLIGHHLVYDRLALDTLHREVEERHKKRFWMAYLDCVDPAFVTRSGAAENELMSHFMLWRWPHMCRIRPLNFRELKKGETDPSLDFASYQSWNT